MGMVMLKLERKKLYCHKSPIFLKDAGTLLVTYIMIIKLNHYIYF